MKRMDENMPVENIWEARVQTNGGRGRLKKIGILQSQD